MTMRPLANKLAIITGASRGIGLAIAQRFSQDGATCILVGRNKATLEDALSQLTSSNTSTTTTTSSHSCIAGSISDQSTWKQILVQATATATHSTQPKIDILINAAGIAQESLLHKTSPDTIDDILDTNLRGTILGCQTIGKQMIRQKEGCIVNVSSIMAYKGGRGASVYAASKAGMLGLTTALSQEYAPFGVRVNALVPGYIMTQMTQHMANSKMTDRIPLGRLGTVEEVADAAVFLATNTYANNCVLNLDGGLSAS